jgi:hypothetical protein
MSIAIDPKTPIESSESIIGTAKMERNIESESAR